VSTPRQLYHIQEHDLALDARREALATIAAQLGETDSLRQAREALDQARQELARLEQAQHQAEWEADDLRGRLATAEENLYSGRVRNPKELLGLQEEAQSLRSRLSKQEDRLLEIMLQAEAAREAAARCQRHLQEEEARWQREQERLLGEKAALEAEVAALEAERHALEEGVAGEVLELYARLRATRQGRAVARVEGGMCQGCRIVLPTHQWQQARLGVELVQCTSCGRILYVS